MAADQSQLEAAVSAVREPEIGLTLGDLGLVRSVRPRRRRVQIEVALPVAAWPGTEELAEAIHQGVRDFFYANPPPGSHLAQLTAPAHPTM